MTVGPKITGTPRVGSRLRCITGTFTDTTTISVAWLRNGKSISHASGSTYRPKARDLGARIACGVTAVGPGGTTRVRSPAVKIRHRARPTAPARPQVFKNCTVVHTKYRHGIAKSLYAAEHATGLTGQPKISASLYNANRRLDRDHDGVACET
jgi:hypothetical protein